MNINYSWAGKRDNLRSGVYLGVQTIRATTKPSTAKCDLNTYTLFLLAESKYTGCRRLADIMENLSHAFTQLELMRSEELIENWYEIQRNLSLQVARDFILEHLPQKLGLVA